MSENEEFRAHLEGYRQLGTLDSTGTFSLSEEKAQEKFRHFRLADPKLYVLNLQASAVSGGATWVEFHGDADDLYFSCNASLGSAVGLSDLSSVALSDNVTVPVRELALALNGCLALQPKLLEVCYWDGTTGQHIKWESDKFTYSPAQTPPVGRHRKRQPSLTFHLREKPGLRTLSKFVSRLGGAVSADSEQEVIARHCNCSPCPVRFNGQDIRRTLDPRGSQKSLLLLDGDLPEEHPLSRLSHVTTRPAGGPFRGIIARGGSRLPPWLTLVVNGVNFRMREGAFGGVRGFVYTEILSKDLSQSQLVQDKHYNEIVEALSGLL